MLIESKLKNFDIRPVYERNPDFASDSCGAKVIQSGGDIYVKNYFFGKSTHANLDRVLHIDFLRTIQHTSLFSYLTLSYL